MSKNPASDEKPFGNWKCLGCGAVCDTDPETKPTPCDFCGSTDIVALEPGTERVNH